LGGIASADRDLAQRNTTVCQRETFALKNVRAAIAGESPDADPSRGYLNDRDASGDFYLLIVAASGMGDRDPGRQPNQILLYIPRYTIVAVFVLPAPTVST